MSSALSSPSKTDILQADSSNAQGEGGELALLFSAGYADCSFGINQSVSKVWAGD